MVIADKAFKTVTLLYFNCVAYKNFKKNKITGVLTTFGIW